MSDPIFVQCGGCEGEGHIYHREQFYSPLWGWTLDDVDDGECPYCSGFGTEEVEGEPITLEDLP